MKTSNANNEPSSAVIDAVNKIRSKAKSVDFVDGYIEGIKEGLEIAQRIYREEEQDR